MRVLIPTLSTLFVTGALTLLAGVSPASAQTLQEETPAVEKKEQGPGKAFWPITPEEAFIEAAKKNKLSIIICLSPGMEPSDRTLNGALQDKAVLKWLAENSIAVKQLADGSSKWIKRKGIRTFPTVAIRTSNRKLIDVIHGYRSTEEWLVLLDTAKRTANTNSKPEGDAASDPYSWMAYGSYLFGSSGEPEEIGNAFLWCLDHAAAKDPEFLEKHINFLLRKLVQVAKYSPNVKQSVYLRRDALHNKVVSGKASTFEAFALSRFGIYLRDMDDTIRAFNQIVADTPHKLSLKSVILWSNLERMVAYRRYEDILEHISDPLAAMEARMAAIVLLEKGETIKQESSLPRPPGAGPVAQGKEESKIKPELPLPGVQQTRPALVIDASLLYECLLATAKLDEAKALLIKITEFVPTGRAYSRFIERSNRLQMMDITHETAAYGAEKVPEDQIWRIENMVIRGTRGSNW